MSILSVSQIIAAFVSAALGVAALLRNFRSALCLKFALVCCLLFAHDAMSVLQSFEGAALYTSVRFHSLALLALGPATLWLLVEIAPTCSVWVRRLYWFYLPFLLILALAAVLKRFSVIHPWIFLGAQLVYVIPVFAFIFGLVQAERESRLMRPRLRYRYACWGGVITTAFFVTNALHFSGMDIPPLGTLARILYLMFMFQTFVQRELVTVEEIVGKLSLLGGVGITLSAIYFLLVSWVGDRGGLFVFNTLIASFVIVVLFDPIRRWSTTFTRKLFLRQQALVEDELGQLSNHLRGQLDIGVISKKISTSLKSSLGIEKTAVFVLDKDDLSFVEVGGEDPREVQAADPIIEYMHLRKGRPFLSETVESDEGAFYGQQPRHFFANCKRALQTLQADFIIPFLQESRVVGFVAATSGRTITLSNDQLRIFMPLGRQVGMMLRNAESYAVLRDREKLAAVGEMAAGLAHEIRNPLGAIKGAAQLLKDTPGLEKDDFIQIIMDETNRLSNVLSEFLDYAKPRGELPNLSCDPKHVIEHTLELLKRDHTQVSFRAELGDKIQMGVDPEMLKQVLLNLCLNAAQAADSKNPEVVVRLRTIGRKRPFFAELPLTKIWQGWNNLMNPSGQTQFVEIEVQDNGSGISNEALKKIFVPFYTTKPNGTGLGLAICQRLVENMQGTINVRRNRPRGTIFVLHLPVHQQNSTVKEGGRSVPLVRAPAVP